MGDKTKVPEHRVFDVLYSCQPHLGRVVCNYSNGKEIWIIKKGRDHTINFRCDRSVREAITRGWCERDRHGTLVPTKLGLEVIAAKTG
jgi:hypothetical protein